MLLSGGTVVSSKDNLAANFRPYWSQLTVLDPVQDTPDPCKGRSTTTTSASLPRGTTYRPQLTENDKDYKGVDDTVVHVTIVNGSPYDFILSSTHTYQMDTLTSTTFIIITSMIGFGASLLIPSKPTGFLGLPPILLGIWKLVEVLFPEEDEESEKSKISGVKSILRVSAITVMNGGDNIGTYIPLFAQAKAAEIAVYIVTYYILVGVWCLVAFLVMKQGHIWLRAKKYASVVVPVLYLGLGVYIIVKLSCYRWSIERIDNSTSIHLGQSIMAVVTTVLLLACIGAMLWSKLRKEVSRRPDSDVSQGNSPSPTAETELSSSYPPV
ncbi:LOW QUALITY PROTEIN: hypothetical protein IFM46972_06202 [Aspergillus udagawae]|uniref:Cadmium resistance transporter n=1 Tax=Aspergillus udagawae TaxID=91492 RepID=A0A8H3P2G1_9EURO|nr:LOW QUALITY PROTEIN: hypothetical protein IFM46972_06202 [Aspergillus udagawae]